MAVLDRDDPRRARMRADLITRCAPIAHHEAARYRHGGESVEDLNQVALLGLILAVDRFDASRNIGFRHFAIPTITGELKRHFRDRSWSMRVSRRMQELSIEVRGREPELAQRLGRMPTTADLAEELDLSEEDVVQGREAISVHTAQSLNIPMFHDGRPRDVSDTVGYPDAAIEAVADHDALHRALRQLPQRLRNVLALRFADELTQTQIADKLGISQMHVSRLIARSLRLLRRHMLAERPTPMRA
jgi:RNA polymerase sigma-B factor